MHAQSPELFNYARTELSRLCEEEELDSRVIRRAAVDVGSNLPRLEKDMRQRTYCRASTTMPTMHWAWA